MQQGASKETGGKVAAGFGETRGVISKLSGATKPFEKLAVGAAPGALKIAGAGLQVQGQIEQGKSPEAAIANVGGQGATSIAAGIAGGAVAGFFGGGPIPSAIGAVAGAFGADVSGLSEAGGNMTEKMATTRSDHPILEYGK